MRRRSPPETYLDAVLFLAQNHMSVLLLRMEYSNLCGLFIATITANIVSWVVRELTLFHLVDQAL